MFDNLITRASLDLTASLAKSKESARLLGMLEQRPMSTFELAKGADMRSRQVWANLRWHKDRGHVLFDPKCGVWALDSAAANTATKNAKDLLESQGWKCIPPGQ
jgi:hypothetical protein